MILKTLVDWGTFWRWGGDMGIGGKILKPNFNLLCFFLIYFTTLLFFWGHRPISFFFWGNFKDPSY